MSGKRLAPPESHTIQDEERLGEGLERPELYINRELSQLEFSRRVLEEAEDPRHPLLERVKFLAIFESTIDDFFVLRVSGLKEQQASKVIDYPPDGMTPTAQLAAIRQRLTPMLLKQCQVLKDNLLPALAEAGIEILNYAQLDEAQRIAAAAYFHREVFPIVTPLAVDPGHPFPHISNLSLNLAVILRSPLGRERFARLKIPPTLPRFVPVPVSARSLPPEPASADALPLSIPPTPPSESATPPIPSSPPEPARVAFVWLEQVVAAHLDTLFRGMEIVRAYPFRVMRDADIEIQEDEASDSDLLEEVQHGLRERRFGAPVQLCVDTSMPAQVCGPLLEHLELSEEDVLVFDGPLRLADMME
ncbi:MAG TPA: hypothetical protein VH590_19985, partial [Ktedonobacterales bacterium]